MPTKRCTFPGCDREHNSKGLCSSHGAQQRAGIKLRPIRVLKTFNTAPCRAPGCTRRAIARGLCSPHSQQRRKGRRLKPPCPQGPSRIFHDGTSWVIELCHKDGSVNGHARISKQDVVKCRTFRWNIVDSRGRTAYVGTTLAATKHRPRTKYALHRFIFGLTDPKIEVDHWNGDALDCRRSNMYVVDRQKNQQNRPALSSTGHRNVYWRKRQKDYVVRARRDDKGFWGGRFDVLAEAVLAARALRTSVFAHANEARASEVKPSGARRKRHAH